MEDNIMSFRIDNNPNDSPDQFIKKMKNTMAKKRKNNYKNIEELENIYDNPKKKKTYSDEYVPGELMESFDELEENMKNIFKDYSETAETKEMPYRQKEETGEKPKNHAKDKSDGFSNLDDYKNIYKPEYEYDKNTKVDTDKLKKDAENGTLDTVDLQNLLDTGKITQSQYNDIFGWFLNFKGFDWKNMGIPPKKKERCPKFSKNCGDEAGNNIMDYFNMFLAYVKMFFGLYNKALTKVSTWLYNSTDGKMDGNPSKSKDDVSILVDILHYIIMVPLAMYFSYNWYYVSFYRDELEKPLEFDFSDNIMSMLKGLLMRFFKCLVQPVIVFDALIRKYIPKLFFMLTIPLKYVSFGPVSLVGKILTNPIFIYICLTLFILAMSCIYSDKILDALIAFLGDGDMPFASILYVVVMYDLIVGIGEINVMVKYFNFLAALLSPVSTVFWFLVLLVFSLVFIRFAGLFVVLYMYIVSYAGLAIFSSGNMYGALKSVNLAFKSSVDGSDNTCPKTKWEKFILNLLNVFYDYLIGILYIIILSYSMYLIFTNMKSSSSKIILGTMLAMIMAMIVMVIAIFAFQNKDAVSKSDIDI